MVDHWLKDDYFSVIHGAVSGSYTMDPSTAPNWAHKRRNKEQSQRIGDQNGHQSTSKQDGGAPRYQYCKYCQGRAWVGMYIISVEGGDCGAWNNELDSRQNTTGKGRVGGWVTEKQWFIVSPVRPKTRKYEPVSIKCVYRWPQTQK